MQHPNHLMPDMMVGPFRIQARLGAGGFGAVFRVESGGEQYALKFAAHAPDSDDPNRTDARAQRELACLLLITHPNVVRVWAHGRWPHPRTGFHYVVMDYVEGTTLIDWVKQTRPPLRQVVRQFDTLALTLDALHAQDIHHRDLKGSNILVRARDGEPVLVDFGAAEHAGQDVPLTEGPLPPGTPHLRTPEALRFLREQYADPYAHYRFRPTDDLYALGATLYEALTGTPPFPPTLPREVLSRLIEEEMPASPSVLNAQVPPALGALVLRLLAKRPEERPQSGRALHELFQALLHDDSPALEVALLPGADVATTEGMGRPAVMSSADHPERPLPGSADGGETHASPGSTSQRETTVPTVLAERASPGSPGRTRRWWLTGAAALGLLALVMVALWRERSSPPSGLRDSDTPPSLPGAPESSEAGASSPEEDREPSMLARLEDAGPPLHAADGGSTAFASLFPDAGPLAMAEAPLSTPQKKGSLMPRTKPPATNPTAPPEPTPLQRQDAGVAALAGMIACTLAGGCATLPPESLGPPPPEPCPALALEIMKTEFRIGRRSDLGGFQELILMPGSNRWADYSREDTVIALTGRQEVEVLTQAFSDIGPPAGALLVGDFFIRGRLYARFFEVRLPNGQRRPFCADLYDRYDGQAGIRLHPESKPGEPRVHTRQTARWYWEWGER